MKKVTKKPAKGTERGGKRAGDHMRRVQFTVRAFWDNEAGVWVAESDDVPGLITEADTVEQLIAKLQVMVPELLEANGVLPPGENDSGIPFTFLAERQVRGQRRAT